MGDMLQICFWYTFARDWHYLIWHVTAYTRRYYHPSSKFLILLAYYGMLSCMIPHKIIEIRVYILRDIWFLSRHCFNRRSAIWFFWWYHMYDLCRIFETKVPYPPREIIWHNIVMPDILDIPDCNVKIVDLIGAFWLWIGYIDSLSLGNIEIWWSQFTEIRCPINIEVLWYA